MFAWKQGIFVLCSMISQSTKIDAHRCYLQLLLLLVSILYYQPFSTVTNQPQTTLIGQPIHKHIRGDQLIVIHNQTTSIKLAC